MAWRERPRVIAAITIGVVALCLLAGLLGAASSGGTVTAIPRATQHALAVARTDAARWYREAIAQRARATTATRHSALLARALRRSRINARTWKTRALRARHNHHRTHHHHHR